MNSVRTVLSAALAEEACHSGTSCRWTDLTKALREGRGRCGAPLAEGANSDASELATPSSPRMRRLALP